jgi:hypothetical protein
VAPSNLTSRSCCYVYFPRIDAAHRLAVIQLQIIQRALIHCDPNWPVTTAKRCVRKRNICSIRGADSQPASAALPASRATSRSDERTCHRGPPYCSEPMALGRWRVKSTGKIAVLFSEDRIVNDSSPRPATLRPGALILGMTSDNYEDLQPQTPQTYEPGALGRASRICVVKFFVPAP